MIYLSPLQLFQLVRIGIVNNQTKQIFISFVLIIVFLLFVTACHFLNIDNYEGDGTISLTSSTYPTVGFDIDFGQFDLRKKYKKILMLKGYPLVDKLYLVAMHFENVSNEFEYAMPSYLSIKATSYEGDVIFNCSGPMNTWRWSSGARESNVYSYLIYYSTNECRSAFTLNDISEKDRTIYLYIDYVPTDTISKHKEALPASLKLKVGGDK